MTPKAATFSALPKAAIGFRPEFLDFKRGIRVGNLKDNERITRLLKLALESRFQEPFVTERWGRGVFWQWIGFLSRANRAAKPISGHVSFGCSKFFVMIETAEGLFKCGLQVERGFVLPPPEFQHCRLQPDWDWHRLIHSLRRGGDLEKELRRLLRREGFRVFGGGWEGESAEFSRSNPPTAGKLRRLLNAPPGDHWAGFQLYYPMTEAEVSGMTGVELVESMTAIFDEVTPVMNLCMQTKLRPR